MQTTEHHRAEAEGYRQGLHNLSLLLCVANLPHPRRGRKQGHIGSQAPRRGSPLLPGTALPQRKTLGRDRLVMVGQ